MLEKKEVYYCERCHNSIPKGKFCPDCGVHNKGDKSTFKSLFTNSISEVLSVEKGLIYNFKMTFSNPHEIVWSYFNGIRNKYAAPGKFLLYTLFFLGAIYLVDPEFGAIQVDVNGESTSGLTGTKLFLVLIIPILSLSSKIVFWKNKGLAIHTISMLYMFLPRFVIATLLITIINLSIGQHWTQPLLALFLILHTLWSNTMVFKKNITTLQRAGLTLLQLLAVLGVIAFLFLIFILTGSLDINLS